MQKTNFRTKQQFQPKSHKKTNKHKNELEFLRKGLENNAKAYEEGPKIKKWTQHDLRSVRPLTPGQDKIFKAFYEGHDICAYGTAGTGKSYCLLYLALNEIFREGAKQNRIIIIRSAVPTRDIGFLKGTEEDKLAVFERPYIDIVSDLIGKANAYADMKHSGVIEFTTTSYLRGISYNNAIILVDEIQSMNLHEINSVMGRVGKDSIVAVMGDIGQNDLNKKKGDETGFPTFLNVIDKMEEFIKVQFTRDDVVRSNFVRSWIFALEDYMGTLA